MTAINQITAKINHVPSRVICLSCSENELIGACAEKMFGKYQQISASFSKVAKVAVLRWSLFRNDPEKDHF